ncbi:hypothetical protein A5787_07890 [Mycobacterium sp. 852002-50816_SCH5313054-b]|uniref:DUF2510 domain-containing protein n=1 Tax=Mycobacterium sp. 852002-50816_SCH5313054-b TaxID=1834092 RepID=UPI0007FC4321|nr:DUF2510 domain-containing protein [Mycobacterium sp. 852002-50816_SCH5313054-b]OBF50699.1 hypothetical protein A5787_07890 [Mycobacterium sp. 852002-50816_SCH5313054-b]
MTTPNQPGWYDDPQDPNAQRYWDGRGWTPHRQQWPATGPESPGVSGQMAAAGPPAPEGSATKMSVSVWIVFAGLAVTAISTFLPFATESARLFGETLGAREVPANGATKLVVIALVAIGVGLALPVLPESPVVVGRLIGLSVVVGLLAGLTIVWFNSVAAENDKGLGVVEVKPAFGLMVYGAAVIVTAVGVVRLWIERAKTQKRPS